MSISRHLKVRIASAATGPARVDVYDDIGDGGWFGGGISAQEFVSQLSGIKGELDIHVNSGGGDVFDGIAIASAIRDHKGRVTTTVDGIAASIASVIAQAGQERVMAPGSMMMIHEASGGCVGDAAEMAKTAETLDQVSGNLASIYASRAGGTVASWRDAMKTETWYTAEEAVKAGLADRVAGDAAQLPAGLDVAAFSAAPGQIAARLREMPVAALRQPQDAGARHDPMTGTHSHPHPAYGSQGGDSMHSHEHSHDGDASHSHSHGEPAARTAADIGNATGQPYKPQPYHREAWENVQCPVCEKFNDDDGIHCGQCGTMLAGRDDVKVWAPSTGNGLEELFLAWAREKARDAAGKPGTHGDHERWDPDGDGDCDACPEGDTDHDYWTPAGEQLRDVPDKPVPDAGDHLTLGAIRSLIRSLMREEIAAAFRNADVDNSPWDASRAWSAGAASDDPAAFYAGICAGKKAGDKSTQAAWALPYKYSPSSPPNAAGVRNALARLDQTQGLTNKAEAKATLQAAMKKVNPDWEPEDKDDSAPDGHGRRKLSGAHLEQIRAALKGAKL